MTLGIVGAYAGGVIGALIVADRWKEIPVSSIPGGLRLGAQLTMTNFKAALKITF